MSDDILHERIRQARKALGLTQVQAAEKAGMVPGQWAFYEQGRRTPNVDNLRVICTTLDVSSDWLLDLHPSRLTP